MTRINKYIAQATGISRRAADQAIQDSRVTINGRKAVLGDTVSHSDQVSLDSQPITPPVKSTTILLNKPVGYVCSRNGQGSPTIYDLIPAKYHDLKPVGRLDKDSSGLLLMTNDGDMANRLTHPSFAKQKVYEVKLGKPLEPLHHQMIADHGIRLDDGLSRLGLQKIEDQSDQWQVTMSEGRNRQIRRTFEALGYNVTKLHRTAFGNYQLSKLKPGSYHELADG